MRHGIMARQVGLVVFVLAAGCFGPAPQVPPELEFALDNAPSNFSGDPVTGAEKITGLAQADGCWASGFQRRSYRIDAASGEMTGYFYECCPEMTPPMMVIARGTLTLSSPGVGSWIVTTVQYAIVLPGERITDVSESYGAPLEFVVELRRAGELLSAGVSWKPAPGQDWPFFFDDGGNVDFYAAFDCP